MEPTTQPADWRLTAPPRLRFFGPVYLVTQPSRVCCTLPPCWKSSSLAPRTEIAPAPGNGARFSIFVRVLLPGALPPAKLQTLNPKLQRNSSCSSANGQDDKKNSLGFFFYRGEQLRTCDILHTVRQRASLCVAMAVRQEVGHRFADSRCSTARPLSSP